eukprot:6407115-Amphidinium_carterae.1
MFVKFAGLGGDKITSKSADIRHLRIKGCSFEDSHPFVKAGSRPPPTGIENKLGITGGCRN